MASLRIGSRGSQLALWQANHVAALLRGQGHGVEIEVIKTTGDKITEVALSQVGTKGMFTKEIEEALDERRVDLAVHSLKDVPTQLGAQFVLAAVMEREDPHDVLISARFAGLEELPQRARIGTSSLRRQAQLKAFRRDLEVVSLRGNVDTRLRKLASGEFDAIILAAAGVRRLERTEHLRQVIAVDRMCPCAGQGALGIEIRAGDEPTRGRLAFLDHAATRRTVEAERAALNALGGGCQVPIGAFAEAMAGDTLRLTAVVARPDGEEVIRDCQTGADPAELGARVGATLLKLGAQRILNDVYGDPVPTPDQP
jgi:hydroxymethylbilane synthase